jgi:hypothetical protein
MPPGVALTPDLWSPGPTPPAAKLPRHIVSLILQVKRPHYLDHWRAGQWPYWQAPYFRFRLRHRQQQILENLEANQVGHALVRYASAAFTSYDELMTRHAHQTVAVASSFVSPAPLQGHRMWTYASAGTQGYANPEGEVIQSDSYESLAGSGRELARLQGFESHVRTLAESQRLVPLLTSAMLREAQPRTVEIRQSVLDVVAAWLTVASAVALAGGSWLVLAYCRGQQQDLSLF